MTDTKRDRRMTAKQRVGRNGEEAARRYLAALGYGILARNWRPAGTAARYELDLVARHGDVLVFVEVRTRGGFSPARESFSPAKRRRVLTAARHFLQEQQMWREPCRFDLVCLDLAADGRYVLEHHTNVIEHSLDSGDAAWQPW